MMRRKPVRLEAVLVAVAVALAGACTSEDAKVAALLGDALAKVKAAKSSGDEFEVGVQCLAYKTAMEQEEVKRAVGAGAEPKKLADELAGLCKDPGGAAGGGTGAAEPLLPPVDDEAAGGAGERVPAGIPASGAPPGGATAATAGPVVPGPTAGDRAPRLDAMTDTKTRKMDGKEPAGATSAPDMPAK